MINKIFLNLSPSACNGIIISVVATLDWASHMASHFLSCVACVYHNYMNSPTQYYYKQHWQLINNTIQTLMQHVHSCALCHYKHYICKSVHVMPLHHTTTAIPCIDDQQNDAWKTTVYLQVYEESCQSGNKPYSVAYSDWQWLSLYISCSLLYHELPCRAKLTSCIKRLIHVLNIRLSV